jgi:hypothetical protein
MIDLFAFVAEEETAIRFAQTKFIDQDSTISYKFLEPVGQFQVTANLTEKDYKHDHQCFSEEFWVKSIPYEEKDNENTN